MKKVILTGLVLVCLIASLIAGCAPKKEAAPHPEPAVPAYPRTIVDSAGRTVTIDKPIQRIVGRLQVAEAIKILGAEDKMVGVGDSVKQRELFFPELSKLPSVGERSNPNIEKIIELKPDVVIWTRTFAEGVLEKKLEPLGITVIRLDLYRPETILDDLRKLAYILEKEDEAKKFIDWYEGYMNAIKQRTTGLPEDERPKVYFEMFWDYMTCTRGYGPDMMIRAAGGRNIAANLEPPDKAVKVSPEWVVAQNPDIIVKSPSIAGVYPYNIDDPKVLKDIRDAILNRPGFSEITAVKKGRVYVGLPWGELVVTPRSVIGTAYMAKWFHPELFKDLDPKAIHQEYLKRFMRIDYDLDTHGVFVYHPEQHPDGR
ncbi:ABC transporter substrate-binding protein [Calderihabitans maritimus]|uniref:Putative ABC transporter, solute binding protein n=1 Tax=Calderihabitans maritimus TaxID=1246530 RepID=A0A1Z5HSJ5_9FIRM|nr:ABC transporter substrate-binding protein [Calderihabitans maritimus]GAW92492.1 putative ABC transporter, solute binding protein [Calderihabitans maritimus]